MITYAVDEDDGVGEEHVLGVESKLRVDRVIVIGILCYHLCRG